MAVWHEDESFWLEHGPLMFHAQRWEGTGVEIDGVIALLGLAPGAKILDLPCGPGRHSIELARRGFAMTGVDRTEQYLDEARCRADAAGVSVEWRQADMREFREPEAFDAAINMYTSFGYFVDQAEDLRVLENFCASLKPGGRLLMELMGKEVLARTFQQRVWKELPDGTHLLSETKICNDWSWVEGRWLVLRNGSLTEHTISHRVCSRARRMTRARCGWWWWRRSEADCAGHRPRGLCSTM